MSKKSYKQLQNRLYREIKRRLLAESVRIKPPVFAVTNTKIDTLKVAKEYSVCDYDPTYDTFIKVDIANEMCKKLIEDGYIQFYTEEKCQLEPIWHAQTVRAVLKVVKPT